MQNAKNKTDITELEGLLLKHKAEFEKYLQFLLKWNKTYNLTTITDPFQIWEKHFLDSIMPLKWLPMSGRLLDIGSGPGFPGIPIKLARPALSVTLLEATKKKCNFCEEVIRELNLKDINVVHGRAEDGNIQKTASKFNIIISRATVSLEKLLEISQPYKMDNNCNKI